MKKDVIAVYIDLNVEATKVLNMLYPEGYCNDWSDKISFCPFCGRKLKD